MKLIRLSFFCMLFFFTMTACKKSTGNAQNYNAGLLKSVTTTVPPNQIPQYYSFTFTYGQDGTLTVGSAGAGVDVYVPGAAKEYGIAPTYGVFGTLMYPMFPYTSFGQSLPIWYGVYNNTAPTDFFTNSLGRVDSNNEGATLSYDNNGYLVRWTYSPNSDTAINIISNGNIVSTILPLQNYGISPIDTATYTFLPTLDNRSVSDHIASLLGTGNKNLVSTVSHTYTGLPYCQHYYYFDSNQRVIEDSMVWNGQMARTYTYTYY